MARRMLIDASHPEETRVVVVDGTRLEEFDFETASRKPLKGNIYLAKVIRIEPSLQAAFVEYGGNRHGFLAFSEIHPDYYQIPVADRERLIAEQQRLQAESEDEPEPQRKVDRTDIEEAKADNLAAAESKAALEDRDEAASGQTAESAAHEESSGAEAAIASVEPADAVANSAPEPEAPRQPATMASERLDGPTDAEVVGAAETPPAADLSSDAPTEVPEGEPPIDAAEASQPEAVVETLGGDDVIEQRETRERRRRSHVRLYKIQEVIKRRQILLVQVVKEERGNKGAALTTYLSLAGRYCVLMPNAGRSGGISRKISNPADRKRMKEVLSELDVPQGMGVILRTAGLERSTIDIKRDYEYLTRLWDSIRELTMRSTAPALIYEEGDLIKRSLRDVYDTDIAQVLVEGEAGFSAASEFMRQLMPHEASKVVPYKDQIPLFHRYQVESQFDAMHSPVVQLKSGGYIVINPTEALVAIDVNSGRATKERNIEETALRTNLEAAEEIARQVRLRDLAGLIVIDFIDMEEARHQRQVEHKVKEAMRHDRARIQIGRVSAFGLLEMSRQRLRPSLLEHSTEICPHCAGTGRVRSIESAALHALRAIEEEGVRRRASEIVVSVQPSVALYLLNQKRHALSEIEKRYNFTVSVEADDELHAGDCEIERVRSRRDDRERPAHETARASYEEIGEARAAGEEADSPDGGDAVASGKPEDADGESREGGPRRRRRRRRRGRRDGETESSTDDAGRAPAIAGEPSDDTSGGDSTTDEKEVVDEADGDEVLHAAAGDDRDDDERTGGEHASGGTRRHRGRRGGRRRGRENGHGEAFTADELATDAAGLRDASTHGEPVGEHQATMHHAAIERPIEQPAEYVSHEAAVPTPSPPPEPPAPPPSPPVPSITGSPENPRRGWWRR